MPAKKQITKEKILAAALDMVRENGMESINARSLAKKLNCSTQPIYLSFNSIDDLKKEVVIEVWKVFSSYLNSGTAISPNTPYSRFGAGYRQFSREEKELFKFLFLEGNSSRNNDIASPDFQNSVKMIMEETGFGYDKALNIHLAVWTIVHGVATMLATSTADIEEEKISKLVSDIYEGLKLKYASED